MENRDSPSSNDSSQPVAPFIVSSKIVWQAGPGESGKVFAKTDTENEKANLLLNYLSQEKQVSIPMGNSDEIKFPASKMINSEAPFYSAFREGDGHLYIERIPGNPEDGEKPRKELIKKGVEAGADYSTIDAGSVIVVIEVFTGAQAKHKTEKEPDMWGSFYFFDKHLHRVGQTGDVRIPTAKTVDGSWYPSLPDDAIVWSISSYTWVLMVDSNKGGLVARINNKTKKATIIQEVPELTHSLELYGFDDSLYQLREEKGSKTNISTHSLIKFKVKMY